MTPAPSVLSTLLEKVAADNGFDRFFGATGEWLAFASTQAPLRVWLSAPSKSLFVLALSRANVAAALEHAAVKPRDLPEGAVAARMVTTIPALHQLVRRAFQLSRTLPDELLHEFEKATAFLPKTTEAERLVVQRVGQDIFRRGLLDYWEGRCAVTGLAVPELLRASHIKPWAACESDADRLEVYNGLLLAPQLDAAFDCGLITVEDDGEVVISPRLGDGAREVLGLVQPLRAGGLTANHHRYLRWHRTRVFQSTH